VTREDDQRREDLAATSESIHDDARQLARVEDEKHGLEVGDSRLVGLSKEAERLAGNVARKSRVERALSEGRTATEAEAEAGHPEGPLD
jgi:hypothetical protein